MNLNAFPAAIKHVFKIVMIFILFTGFSIPFYGETIIEDFDDGEIELESWSGEDIEPQGWELSSGVTYQNSPFALRVFGNTWKLQQIESVQVDSNEVWQVAALIDSQAEIQGFGVSDGENVIYYAFAGSQEVDPEIWIPVYQGAFTEGQWNNYQLPIADDWLARFGYLPQISQLVYVNDKDNTSQGVIFFDQITNISDDLPIVPRVSIKFENNGHNKGKDIQVQFRCEIIDPDSDVHEFFWDFGDGTKSNDQDPIHTFSVGDDHPYTVFLQVVDDSDQWGWASCKINVDPGISSFPVKLNFVGDIMMARKYEYAGGIIPTQGVEAIFEPTKPWLGDAADITIANLECVLTTHWEHHPTKSIYFKGSPQNVAGLVYAGIDIVTLANNHTLDYMLPGMQETQAVLEENNIIHSGAGAGSNEAYRPAFYSHSGLNFAFLASCDRTGQYNNYQPFLNAGYNKEGFGNLEHYYIKKQIDEVKGISDLIIMEWHAGIEYSTNPGIGDDDKIPFADDIGQEENYSPLANSPSRSNIELRHFAIDNGADLVICHHPHIMQAVELYHGKLIAHSLGDFAFDLDYPETFPSFILNVEADETGFSRFTLTPVYIDNYIPRRAQGELGLYILDDLAKSSKVLNTYLEVDRESVTAKVMMDTLNMNTAETDFDAELVLNEENGSWQSVPYPIKNAGSISSVNYIKPDADYQFRLGSEKIWFGNMEDEGCSLWYLNSADETFCDTAAFAGQRSIQHRRDENSPYNIVTNFDKRIVCLSDTLNFTLCGYIKTSNGDDVTIEVQYFEDRTGGNPIGQESIDTLVNGDSPWTFYYKNLTIPAGTEFFDIRLNSGHPESGEALSWFDNVGLVCWDNWGEYEIEESIPVPNDYYFLQVKSGQNVDEIEFNYSESVFEQMYVGIEKSETSNSSEIILEQNFPNPFNPSSGPTKISFRLTEPSKVKLSVYDLQGQLIRVLANDVYEAGNHDLFWDGKNNGRYVNLGVYFYRLETEKTSITKKCVVFNL